MMGLVTASGSPYHDGTIFSGVLLRCKKTVSEESH